MRRSKNGRSEDPGDLARADAAMSMIEAALKRYKTGAGRGLAEEIGDPQAPVETNSLREGTA